jgi:hypothetical protein
LSFKTAFLTRPLIILCGYGYIHDYFSTQRDTKPYSAHGYDFGSPELFIPQRQRFKNNFTQKFKFTLKLARRMLYDKIYSITGEQ